MSAVLSSAVGLLHRVLMTMKWGDVEIVLQRSLHGMAAGIP